MSQLFNKLNKYLPKVYSKKYNEFKYGIYLISYKCDWIILALSYNSKTRKIAYTNFNKLEVKYLPFEAVKGLEFEIATSEDIDLYFNKEIDSIYLKDSKSNSDVDYSLEEYDPTILESLNKSKF